MLYMLAERTRPDHSHIAYAVLQDSSLVPRPDSSISIRRYQAQRRLLDTWAGRAPPNSRTLQQSQS